MSLPLPTQRRRALEQMAELARLDLISPPTPAPMVSQSKVLPNRSPALNARPASAQSTRSIHTASAPRLNATPTKAPLRVAKVDRITVPSVDVRAMRNHRQRTPDLQTNGQYKRVLTGAEIKSRGSEDRHKDRGRSKSAVDIDRHRVSRVCVPQISDQKVALDPLLPQPVLRMKKMVLDVIETLRMEADKIRKIQNYPKKVLAMHKLGVTQKGIIQALVDYAQKSQKAGHDGAVIRHEMTALLAQLSSVFSNIQTLLDGDVLPYGRPAVVGRPFLHDEDKVSELSLVSPSEDSIRPIPTENDSAVQRPSSLKIPSDKKSSRTDASHNPSNSHHHELASAHSKHSVGIVTSPYPTGTDQKTPKSSEPKLTKAQSDYRYNVARNVTQITHLLIEELLEDTVRTLTEMEKSKNERPTEHVAFHPGFETVDQYDDAVDDYFGLGDEADACSLLEAELRRKYGVVMGQDRLLTEEERELKNQPIQVTNNRPTKSKEKYDAQKAYENRRKNPFDAAYEDIEEPESSENGIAIDTLDDGFIERLYDERDEFERYAKMSMGIQDDISGLSDPWVIMEVLTDDLLAEVLDESANDVNSLCDDYVEALLHKESLVPRTSAK